MAGILEPIKKYKNLKNLLTNLLQREPHKITSRVACSPQFGQPWSVAVFLKVGEIAPL